VNALILNAREAMPQGGMVRIRARNVVFDKPDAILPEGHYIKITITDRGPGIPDEMRPKIFDPYFTTKQGKSGTGLGLYITKKVVEDHSGSIKVESTPQVGTSFTIRLPLPD